MDGKKLGNSLFPIRKKPRFGKRYIPAKRVPIPIKDYVNAFGKQEKVDADKKE